MQKTPAIAVTLLTMATLSAAHAQYAPAPGQYSDNNSQPAPIVQGYPSPSNGAAYPARTPRTRQLFDTQPAAGVSVRSDSSNGVETVTASDTVTELRIVQGRANVTIHHPADHSEILVDLPQGQVSLLKDGLYTFNAGTNTVRVLHGEAEGYAGNRTDGKGVKVKEDQELALSTTWKLKSVNAYPYELTADLLPGGGGAHGDGYAAPGYGPYGDGYFGGYPYAGLYGYPYGYGFYPGYYPFGFGVGFGYYRGFGGFRGGFRR